MKKILSLILCCFLTALAAGCGKTEDKPRETADISYEGARVSYLGPEGTYTQMACREFFGKAAGLDPYETVSDAVTALTEGRSDYAVIPQENTIGGAVVEYIDNVIDTEGISVRGEVVLTIDQDLLVMPGASLDGIKTVYSHKQGIAQSGPWLKANLPNAEVIEVSSTAEGARMVSEGKDPSCAAIAAEGCAEVYGLEILARSIQNNDNNRTRFYVLSTEAASTADSERIAFVASGPAECLPGLIAGIDRYNAKLITIHERPLKTDLGHYNYLVECEGLSYQALLRITKDSKLVIRFLGCFDVK